jgi:iron complex transport system ATP-binding protein
MEVLLEVRNLSFGYNKADVLTDISFAIRRGEILFLLGPNGCGKTTLLDCVLGFLKPRQGEIYLNGNNIKDIKAGQIARQLAYVPQSHEKTFPYTVMDIVLMGRASYIGAFSAPSRQDKTIAEDILQMLGIYSLKDRPYTQLSGGEGQLVMIARALVQQTDLIVMDEPTSHLDFEHELVIMETIVDLVKETGISILIASHFPNHAFYFENNELSCQVALMNEHRFLDLGKPSAVLSEENLRRMYNVNARLVSCLIDSGHRINQIIPISTLNMKNRSGEGELICTNQNNR